MNEIMPTGQEISCRFIESVLLPELRKSLPGDFERLAVALVGSGSDVIGLDDPVSRDHHWGPRATVLYLRGDADMVGSKVHEVLTQRLPSEFQGYPVRVAIGNLTGVCSCAVEDFFRRSLGTDRLPENDLDWLQLCEADLFQVTAGKVIHDGPGELTCRRRHLAYYPDNVWKKRIADWSMYVTGRDAPYNLYRMSKRGDDLTCAIYFALCLKRLMELGFALNCRYAPYTKWLHRLFRSLPKYAEELGSWIDKAMDSSAWKDRVMVLIEANHTVANALHELGLAGMPRRRPFDEGLTDLVLYESAAEIYRALPPELLAPSFHQIEHWERMAREVLFDSRDYLAGRTSSAAGSSIAAHPTHA